ncbi:peptide deformylase [Candidatus Pelagibacter bacterium]|nr:peptide deformylase [Candidatus Pelagibacter bacterium]
MTIRKILTEPDPFLRQKSIKVVKVDDDTRSLMDDMLETMYEAPGIGLAAIQIGIPKRIIVIDLSRDDEKKNPLCFVNPELITNSNISISYEEGCLSVPGMYAEINRPDKCKLKYLDYNGNEKILEAEGLLATCIQHEIDHLEGILFIDYLSKLKKTMIVKKLSKQKKSLERIVV